MKLSSGLVAGAAPWAHVCANAGGPQPHSPTLMTTMEAPGPQQPSFLSPLNDMGKWRSTLTHITGCAGERHLGKE